MCETTDAILKMAANGKSKTYIADQLGLSRRKLGEILEAMGEVEFNVYPTYEVRGEKGTINKLIKKFGIKCAVNTVYDRMRKGMTIEDALFTPTFGTHTVRGKTGSIEELIKKFRLDINVTTVTNRVLKLGMDLEPALFTPVHQVRRKHASQRPVPKSARSVLRSLHVQQVRVSE